MIASVLSVLLVENFDDRAGLYFNAEHDDAVILQEAQHSIVTECGTDNALANWCKK